MVYMGGKLNKQQIDVGRDRDVKPVSEVFW
jgi:hypothetical protein